MAEILNNVNWLAVGLSTVISFIVGWLWYSPMLFGKKWASGSGVELASQDSPMPVMSLVIQLLATFLLAWLIAVTAANNALWTAILILITTATLIAANGRFVNKSTYAIMTETVFILVMGVIMIGANGVL